MSLETEFGVVLDELYEYEVNTTTSKSKSFLKKYSLSKPQDTEDIVRANDMFTINVFYKDKNIIDCFDSTELENDFDLTGYIGFDDE